MDAHLAAAPASAASAVPCWADALAPGGVKPLTWADALATFQTASAMYDASGDEVPDDVRDAYLAARKALFEARAPHAEAAAYKLAVFGEMEDMVQGFDAATGEIDAAKNVHIEMFELFSRIHREIRTRPAQALPTSRWRAVVGDVRSTAARVAEARAAAPDEDHLEELDAAYDAHWSLVHAVAPRLADIHDKMRRAISATALPGETFDDALFRLFDETDDGQILVCSLQDIETQLRLGGCVIDLHPRSFNRRLAALGCDVSANGIKMGKADGAEVLGLLATLQDQDLDILMAASWIDDYLDLGGRLTLMKDAAFFIYPMPPPPALPSLLRLIDPDRENGALRVAVAKLAADQMRARGVTEVGGQVER